MNGLSLFSNVGIGEYFLKKNNIHIKVANEVIEKRAQFYAKNYPDSECIIGDIRFENISNLVIEKAIYHKCDFIIATPPCQGMSVLSNIKDKRDKRNNLIYETIHIIKSVKPKYVLIENVPQIQKTLIDIDQNPVNIIDYIRNSLLDYTLNIKVVNCMDYGIPQNRKRTIILLSRSDVKEWKFKETKTRIKTLFDTIGHLPSLESGQSSSIKFHYAINHNDNHILWMKHTPTGKTAIDNPVHYPQKEGRRIKCYRSAYRRLRWDKPASTITTNSAFISSQNNVHPGRKQIDGTYSDARCLTILEIMLLTGLDKHWKIPEWASDKFIREVIGEGIPPMLIFELTRDLNEKA